MVNLLDCQPDSNSEPAYACSYTLKQLCHHAYRDELYEKLRSLKIKRADNSVALNGDAENADGNMPVGEDLQTREITEVADLLHYLDCTSRENAIKELGGLDAFEFCVDCVWSAKHNTAQARHTVDRIHGHISFPRLFWEAIIDCLIVQRQRTLTQFGGMFYTFPTATHTRFEHALGVSYVAGVWLDTLALRTGDLSRSRHMWKLRMAVQIAGICHDIGHGPYSHAFESYVRTLKGFENWKHERMSIRMFKVMAKSKRVKALMSDFGVSVEDVTRRISGLWPSEKDNVASEPLTAEERLEIGSRYLINNRFTGIDADRFDYLVRDQKVAPKDMPGEVRTTRIIDHSALGRDGHIVYNIKALDNIIKMFDVRFSMYQNIYRHRCNMVFECMHRDLLRYIDPIYNIKRCLVNFHKYVELNEHLLSPWAIESNIRSYLMQGDHSNFSEARYQKTMTLIKRLKSRRPYAHVIRATLSASPADVRFYNMLRSSEDLLKYRPAKYMGIRVNSKNIHVCQTNLRPTSGGSPFEYIQFFSGGVDEHALLSVEERKSFEDRWNTKFIDIYASKLNENISKVVFACVNTARSLAENDSENDWVAADVPSYDTDEESSIQADLLSDESEFDSPSEGSWDSHSDTPGPTLNIDSDYVTPAQIDIQNERRNKSAESDEFATPKSKNRKSQPPYWNNRFR